MTFSISFPMRRLLLGAALATTALLAPACTKEEPSSEEQIKQYISTNGVTTAQRQSSGLYFVPGTANPTGTRAVAGKNVSVLYTGALLNGTVFDATSRHTPPNAPFTFLLGAGQVIAGWDEGIALMRKGEKATLLIPSALGYGSRGSGTIPADAPLRFEVEVVDVR